MPPKNLVTGLIFAGGRGTRMGHVDKGLQDLQGQPLIAHAIKRLAPQVGLLMINANRNIEAYQQFGLPVFPDALAGFAGPLAGLQSGLRHSQTRYLATVPCDCPFFPDDLVARLYEALVAHDADIAVAATKTFDKIQTQPVFSLLKSSLLPELDAYLASGQRKIQVWHDALKKVDVMFENEKAFENINTMEALRQASRQTQPVS